MSHISYSELKEWTDCAWKHKLNYIDKIKQFKGNEHTSFGSALHTVCEVIVQDYDENNGFATKKFYQIKHILRLQFQNFLFLLVYLSQQDPLYFYL